MENLILKTNYIVLSVMLFFKEIAISIILSTILLIMHAMGNHEITETSPSVFVTSWETLY